ncbi:unnamed protein product [Echinostoma caproni]|uniref:Uncharacterized protein n=1 Tax=Echinostoma caproni TaxID=27848 RepID=A0A183ANJ7_9TREM|nr:unnamed protein product [Echinostoma caproni]
MHVRFIPRNPPKQPPFRNVLQGEGTADKILSEPGRDIFKALSVSVPESQSKNGLNPETCAEASRALQSLQKMHIHRRRDQLRPILAREEACLNEELRKRFGAVTNYASY